MMVKLTRPRAILFDWDNTLVNTWPTIHEALNVLMREKGREEWTLDQTKANVKKSMRDAFPAMF
ncbi:MAG: HAD hydrolase-like protein, partial [Rickettsiales bacterium]|nr:HAD hydrolase-like protein [Rickettsiales bacterium]